MRGADAVRPEIASAWRRAELSGLDPGSPVAEQDLADVDRHSRLMVAARPVLDDLAARLEGTRFSLLLADRRSRIVDRRFGHPSLARALDAVLAVPGHRYSEETTGTNALASTFEVRRGMAVHGEEHFLDRLKAFSCYGAPILHPVTGRLAGVLDVTGYARDATPVLEPLVTLAARAVEQRLLHDAGTCQQLMLAAYQSRTARTRRPVLVFGDGLTLANDAASDLLDGPSQLVLREMAGRATAAGGGTGHVLLASGAEIRFACAGVDGARATVVEILPDRDPAAVVPRTRRPVRAAAPGATELAALRRGRAPVLVSGEPGTGRTRTVALLAGDAPAHALDPGQLAGATAADLAVLADAAAQRRGPTVVEHVELLADVAAVRLSALIDTGRGWFVLTSGPRSELHGERRALADRCAAHLGLVPLRARRAEIPGLAGELLALERPGAPARLTPAALRALVSWSWPGNVRELRAVLLAAALRRPGGDILATDLGLDLGRGAARRPLSPLEQAESDTIRAVLRRHRGNKTHAAAELGIGRTTLYRRLRELGPA